MSGRVDTAEGRRLLDEARTLYATRGISWQIDVTFQRWIADNIDALLAAAEENDTLREALKEIAHRGQVFDAKGTWSKRVCEIARTALAATGGQP